MRRLIATAAAALALAPVSAGAIVVTSAPTPPPNQTVTYTYKTFFEPEGVGPGPMGDLNQNFGTLTLTFNANRIISGTYRPDYGSFATVTGGLTGNTFWLDLGMSGRLHLMGRFTHHGFVASALAPADPTVTWRLHAQFAHA